VEPGVLGFLVVAAMGVEGAAERGVHVHLAGAEPPQRHRRAIRRRQRAEGGRIARGHSCQRGVSFGLAGGTVLQRHGLDHRDVEVVEDGRVAAEGVGQRDAGLAAELGVDYLFAPRPEELYPAGFATTGARLATTRNHATALAHARSGARTPLPRG